MKIKSSQGKYTVDFVQGFDRLKEMDPEMTHVLISPHVMGAYWEELNLKRFTSILQISSEEKNKALSKIPDYCRILLKNGLKRNHTIVCIGGGVTMDVASFVAAIIFRGVDWVYYPTTLLSMADSCIGSKNSLQIGKYKNQVGLYNPPKEVFIYSKFLLTTTPTDRLNGWGEMLKVHAIKSPKAFNGLAYVKDVLPVEVAIRMSLRIKKKLIQKDEFDMGPRLVLNYGHSFGHALETATNFQIPHGVAVMIGCDMANYVSWKLGYGKREDYNRMGAVFKPLYKDYVPVLKTVSLRKFMVALRKDKKNRNGFYRLVMPDKRGRIRLFSVPDTPELTKQVKMYLMGFLYPKKQEKGNGELLD